MTADEELEVLKAQASFCRCTIVLVYTKVHRVILVPEFGPIWKVKHVPFPAERAQETAKTVVV